MNEVTLGNTRKLVTKQYTNRIWNDRELTVEANKSMLRQSKEMHVIKRQVEDRIEALNDTVDKKEKGLSIKLQETREKFAKV